MRRYPEYALKRDLGKKMVFLSGPRQVGRIALANAIMDDYADAPWRFPSNLRNGGEAQSVQTVLSEINVVCPQLFRL